MKKKIEIKKKIEFPTMIGEVCAISLENHLSFTGSDSVEGNLTLTGRYKQTLASRVEEDFHHDIPVEITLTDPIDSQTGIVDITDFTYDIVDEKYLFCSMELEVSGVEILQEERECDGDPMDEKEVEIPHLEEKEILSPQAERIEDEMEEEDDSFFHLDPSKETYGTFLVAIVRENETINSLLEKYHTTVEELEKYNNLKDITFGSKVIIPLPSDSKNE